MQDGETLQASKLRVGTLIDQKLDSYEVAAVSGQVQSSVAIIIIRPSIDVFAKLILVHLLAD